MADHALFVGWGEVVTGREQQATRVFGETMEYFGRLQQQGEIAGVEPFFLEPHGGDLGGFFLLRGDRDSLAELRWSDELQRINSRATMIVEGFGVVGAEFGDRIQAQMQLFLEAAGELS